MFRIVPIVVAIALFLASSFSCAGPKVNLTTATADIYIMRLEPRDRDSNLAIVDDSRVMHLTVSFKAVQLAPGKTYYAVIASKIGEILDAEKLVWQADELMTPSPAETDAHRIDEINKKHYKTVVFDLSCDREDITQMVDAFNSYYIQMMSTVTFRQDVSPPGYQIVCDKYADISLLTGEKYYGLVSAT
jgi:hypothetical protein